MINFIPALNNTAWWELTKDNDVFDLHNTLLYDILVYNKQA